MRIPAWLFVIGIVVFVGVTGLLAVAAFSVARQVAIDAGDSGILPLSPEQIVSSLPTATQIPQMTAPGC